jgi:hypothetical protein
VGLICRHYDHVPAWHVNRFTRDNDFCFTLKDMRQSIERRDMLTQALSLGEGEEGDCTSFLVNYGSTHHGTLLIIGQLD